MLILSNSEGIAWAIAVPWHCRVQLRWLGNMSYSYPLTRGLTLKILFLGLGKVLPSGSAVVA